LPDEAGVLVALIVLIVVIGLMRPVFVQPKSLFQLLANASFTGMLALGMVFVVCIRDIDLSIGWIFNLSAIVAAEAMLSGVEPLVAALLGIATGGLLGLVNGVLAVSLRIPVIIITLGTAYAYRGLSFGRHRLPLAGAPRQDESILRQGIGQITIFENDPVLFLYSEITDEDAWDRLWHTNTHDKWGEIMNSLMEFGPDGIVASTTMREVFNLRTDAGSSDG
jgi:ribose/xylose/arabinose/galactoside ABC-type transport system permease subunit